MSDSRTVYGSVNLHPLSQMKTGLVWEGENEEIGNRRHIDVFAGSRKEDQIGRQRFMA